MKLGDLLRKNVLRRPGRSKPAGRTGTDTVLEEQEQRARVPVTKAQEEIHSVAGADDQADPDIGVRSPVSQAALEIGNSGASRPRELVEPPQASGFLRMSLVVTASALCGGIAVALWNRRLLSRMREARPVVQEQTSFWDDA